MLNFSRHIFDTFFNFRIRILIRMKIRADPDPIQHHYCQINVDALLDFT